LRFKLVPVPEVALFDGATGVKGFFMADAGKDPQGPAKRRGLGLSSMILAGLVAGVLCGVMFGEWCRPLAVLGDAFIGLLRMCVLPYITLSLVANLAKLSFRQSRRLAAVGGLVLAGLWSLALLSVVVLPQCFPEWKAGSFFSAALIEPPPPIDFLGILIPTNFFASLAEEQIPAVVVFSICVGLSLGTLTNKDLAVAQLDVLTKALLRVTSFVTRLTPVGVFAITASTAGTISLDEFARLQAYLAAYTAGALGLAFIVLPLLISTVTPFRYREVIVLSRDALITAFATGKLIIVLPMLIEQTERLFAEHWQDDKEGTAPAVDVLYPLIYPFPHLGHLLSMMFIPFAAWFLGSAMDLNEYPRLLVGGLFSYFGGPLLAIPFLLDQVQLPHDMFQLFLLSGVYCERLGDLLGAMHLVAFTTITTCAFTGRLRLRWVESLRTLAVLTGVAIVLVSLLRVGLRQSVELMENKEEFIAHLQLLEQPVEYEVFTEAIPNPDPLRPGETLLERIRRRGAIRVGYNEDKLPFSYFNIHHELVGFDINMAHALARDLGVRIEFVRFERSQLARQLADDCFDVVMSGLVGTLERSEQMQHTRPYMDVTLSLVVPDYRVRSFRTFDAMRELDDLKIGFVDLSRGFVERLRLMLPNAELVELPTNGDFFERAHRELDALLISAETGSAFTLFYPSFEVVVPEGNRVALPLFYAIAGRDAEMQDFLEHWVLLREKDGTMRDNYEHWILGKSAQRRQRRWSVIKDVLRWTTH
jgi:Na+/H+-dicarboxylate symporter/ABC-type amino acid transport substrate-binding protein